jgi:hypothetical protein
MRLSNAFQIDTNFAKPLSVRLLIEKIESDFLSVHINGAKSLACPELAILMFVTQTVAVKTPRSSSHQLIVVTLNDRKQNGMDFYVFDLSVNM